MAADDPTDDKNDVVDPPKEGPEEDADDINDGDGTEENAGKEGNDETNHEPDESNGLDENDLHSTKAIDQSPSENYINDRNDEGEKPLFKPTESKSTAQYSYIKHGSHLKVLLSTALRAVADGFASASGGTKRKCEESEEKESKKKGRRLMDAEELARERVEECVVLKQVSEMAVFLVSYCFISIDRTTLIHITPTNRKSNPSNPKSKPSTKNPTHPIKPLPNSNPN
jgi:hypothetical protein